MYRYKCIISYDGYDYMGFQIQNDLKTIELELMTAIKKMIGIDVKIYPSGRTDRYVHAINQVIHFDLEKYLSPKGLKRGINTYLPDDIYIKSVELVDLDFHSRFSAKAKEYRYYINRLEYNPLNKRYIANIFYKLDIDKMNVYDEKLEFIFIGTGFLKYQVRKMMGALIDIGRGHLDKEVINKIFETKDSKYSHRVAPGEGLYLYNVYYEDYNG